MLRLSLAVGLTGLMMACAEEPAGGRGPFDPPPPPKINAPLFAQPPEFGANPFPQQPRQEITITDPNTQLSQDVSTALRTTPAPGYGDTVTATPEAFTQPGTQTGTQTGDVTGVPLAGSPLAGDTGIDPNDQSINLSLSSQEEQKRQRAIAEQQRLAAQQQLVIVEPTPVPQADGNANVVRFARETTHPRGTKVYNRPAFRDRTQTASTCRRFDSPDEAQRQFLANGGPQTDRYNLDPDGDGFACTFDPETYRSLNF